MTDSMTDLELKWERRFPSYIDLKEACEDDIEHWKRIGRYITDPPTKGLSISTVKEHAGKKMSAICLFFGNSCPRCKMACSQKNSPYYHFYQELYSRSPKPDTLAQLIMAILKRISVYADID